MNRTNLAKYLCCILIIALVLSATALVYGSSIKTPVSKPAWAVGRTISFDNVKNYVLGAESIEVFTIRRIIPLTVAGKEYQIVYVDSAIWLLEIKAGSSMGNTEYTSKVKLIKDTARDGFDKIADYTADGYPDILYCDYYAGTGGVSAVLNIYSIKDKKNYSLTAETVTEEFYTLPSPFNPNKELAQNQKLLNTCKKYMNDVIGIKELRPTEKELQANAEYAPYQWVIDNGKVTDGKLKIRWYKLPYSGFNNSDPDYTVEYNGIKYCSYFRDCVYGIDKKNNRFFVLYVPESTYGDRQLRINTYDKLLLIQDDEMEDYTIVNLVDYSIQRNLNWEDIPGSDLIDEPTE